MAESQLEVWGTTPHGTPYLHFGLLDRCPPSGSARFLVSYRGFFTAYYGACRILPCRASRNAQPL